MTLSAGAIAGVVSANSVQAAPVGLTTTVTATAAKGAAVGGSTLALVNGTLKIMAWLKAKTAIVISAAVIFTAGITMSELPLRDTLYLCFGLLLCLILPVMMGVHAPSDAAIRKSCMKIVWTGQLLLAIAGLVVLFSSAAALYAIVIGAVSNLACAVVLRWKVRDVRTAPVSKSCQSSPV